MNQNLKLVSLTGPDDTTDIKALLDLSSEFPFVELALLYFPNNDGWGRNPSKQWRNAFFAAKPQCSTALHLCGVNVFQDILNGEISDELYLPKRIQININARRKEFTDDQVLEVYTKLLDVGPELILQFNHETSALITRWLPTAPADQNRIHILIDESKGKGIELQNFNIPSGLETRFCGFAGGIGPDNIVSILNSAASIQQPYWVDMESKLRTDNKFDLAKAREVLQACGKFD